MTKTYAEIEQEYMAREAADHAAGLHATARYTTSLCPGCAKDMGVPAGYQMDDEMRQAQATHRPPQ